MAASTKQQDDTAALLWGYTNGLIAFRSIWSAQKECRGVFKKRINYTALVDIKRALDGGGIGRRKYKFTRILQLTVCFAVRVETTRRKSSVSWRTYTQIVKKKEHAWCESMPIQ